MGLNCVCHLLCIILFLFCTPVCCFQCLPFSVLLKPCLHCYILYQIITQMCLKVIITAVLYLKEKDAEFGGIIGEFMHQNASLSSLNGHNKITLMGTEASPFNKTVHVLEHREKDWMNENHFTCWLIPHLAEALH